MILVSIDGFRWDYPGLYETPALDRMAQAGIRAEALLPVFPTLTFPNHYSIATGLFPAHHGLVGNKFPSPDRQAFYSMYDRDTVMDGSWYRGNPIWVAAESNGMVSAAYFFVGTEAAVNGVSPTHWYAFDADVPGAERVDQVLEWLALDDSARPHLITLYFEDVDRATHQHGPGSPESIAAIGKVNEYLNRLIDGIERLPIGQETYLVVVSDHGQTRTITEEAFVIDEVIDLEGLIVVDHGAAAFLYLPESEDPSRAVAIRDAINASWQRGRAYLRSDTPADWQVIEGAGFADVIVQPDPAYTVFSTREKLSNVSVGNHGWAPDFPDMHGIFYALGPGLPSGKVLAPVRVVDVYPLLMKMLQLPIESEIDGDVNRLPPLLSR